MKSHTLAIALLDPHQLRRPRWVEHCFALCFTLLYSSNSKTYSRTCSIERTTYAWLALVRCARLHLSPQVNHLFSVWMDDLIHTGHLQDHNSYTSANSYKFKQTNILLFKLFSKNDWGWFRRAPHFYARYPASLSALLVASLSKAACGDIRHFSESQPWNFFESSKSKTCNLSVLQSYQSSIAAYGTSLPDSVAVEPKAAKQPSSSVASLSLLPVKDILASILYIGGSEL